MKCLVTGSSGYIGSRLASQLADDGHYVAGIDRDPPLNLSIDNVYRGDLVEPDVCREALDGIDRVYHLAAAKGDFGISEAEYYRDNLEATKTLLDVGEEMDVRDWVFYSTVSTMGPSDEPVPEEVGFDPINPYGASKAEAEKAFRAFAEMHPEIRVMVIRPSVVYGPGNPSSTNIYRLIDAIYRKRFAMVGPGEAVKTTSYIDNLLAATHFLVERLEPGVQTYTYVDRPHLTTGDLVERIYRMLGRKPPSWHIPLSVASSIAYVSDLVAAATGIDLPITAARIEKFNRATNFDASSIRQAGFEQPVSNEEALRRTVTWHLEAIYDTHPSGMADPHPRSSDPAQPTPK
jgi:nucleoside-diphosphate-sugar epimerase